MTSNDPFTAAPDGNPFAEITVGGGPYPKPTDLLGRLLYFMPTKMDRMAKSEQYVKEGEDPMQDVIRTLCTVLDGGELNLEDKDGNVHTIAVSNDEPAEFDNMIWGQSPVIAKLKPRIDDGKPVLARLKRYPQKNSIFKTPEDVEAAFKKFREAAAAGKDATKPPFAWVLEPVENGSPAQILGIKYHNKRLASLKAAREAALAAQADSIF